MGPEDQEDSAAIAASNLQLQLAALSEEHTDLDRAIALLERRPPDDDLLIRRLKKRKLLIKDRINQATRALNGDPDEYA